MAGANPHRKPGTDVMNKPSNNPPEDVNPSVATPATEASAPPAPGSKPLFVNDKPEITMFSSVGGYRVEKLLGEGAMGKVYLAEHEILRRPAAIKVLHADRADHNAVERFFQEARAASAINHPGIVKVYDVGENDEGSFLVMELLDGETLEERLQREEKLEVRDAVRFAVQIASALQAAHENGIVHRDLKPGNIMISPDPEVSGGERIKILDFGIAKMVVSEGDPNVSQTRSDMLLGSPTYMSPEQCRGAQKVDGRADLYSLGCMLFEMLCGRPPFDQQMVAAVIAAHLRETPPAPTSLRPEISPELEAIVLRLLAKDAGERYQSAGELIDAVVQQGGHSLVIKTGASRTLLGASRFFSTMVTERKRRPLALLALLAVAAIVATLVVVLRGGDKGEPKEAAAVADTQPEFEPEELPAPPRPKLRVHMLSGSGGQEDGAGGGGGENLDLTVVEAIEEWDGTFDEATMASLLSGELDISMAARMPLLSITPDGKIVVPWYITSEPAGATVTYADGTPLAEGAVTPIYVEFEAVQREDTLIVQLPGYEPEEITAKFHVPMRRQLTLVTIPEVTLTTEPAGGVVYENGEKIADTPYTTKLSRKAAPRSLSIRLPDHEDYDLELRGGMTFDGPLVMQPLTEVILKTRPRRVDVLANGQIIGATPYAARFSVKKGPPQTLTLSAGEKYEDRVVVLGPGQDLSFADSVIELVPKVEIEVRTREPRHADIFDEAGNAIQATPWTVYMAKNEAPRTVILRHPDYEDYRLEIGPEIELPNKLEMVEIPTWTVDSKPKKAEIVGADGQVLGVTPMRFRMPAKEGPRQLTLRSPGHDDLPVTLYPDKKPPRRFELVRRAVVKLESQPSGARVLDADGKELGVTPFTTEVARSRDKLVFKLVLPGYQPETVEVVPSRDRKEKVRLAAEAAEVAVEIISDPEGAEVYIGREKVGVTPYKHTHMSSSGRTKYTLRLDGYERKEIRVANDENKRVEVELESCKQNSRIDETTGLVVNVYCN